MDINITISIGHDRSQIPVVSNMVSHLCGLADAGDHPSVSGIELAVVEILTNIIDHSGNNCDTNIDLRCRFSGGELTIVVEDRGIPLSSEYVSAYTDDVVSMPALDTGIDSMPENGWGIQLIKSICDNVSYSRKDERNIYTLSFDLSAAMT